MLWWHFQVVLQLREITCEGYCVGVQRHIAGDGHQKQLLVCEVIEKECQSGPAYGVMSGRVLTLTSRRCRSNIS